jgi:hypothetical protein
MFLWMCGHRQIAGWIPNPVFTRLAARRWESFSGSARNAWEKLSHLCKALEYSQWLVNCSRRAVAGGSGTRRNGMLMTIFVILLVLWLLGMVTSYTLYGFIHILLVMAIAVLLIRVIQGRNPL